MTTGMNIGCSSTKGLVTTLTILALAACAGTPDNGPELAQRDWSREGPSITENSQGMLVYQADAALFIECTSGEAFPVVMEDDWLAVERAYLEARQAAGGYAYLTAELRYHWRSPMEGSDRYHVSVTDFQGIEATRTCAPEPDALMATNWEVSHLTELGYQALPSDSRAWIRLQSEDEDRHFQLGGNTGCNAFGGTVEMHENRLESGPMMATRMYCEDTADQEQALLRSLDQVAFSSLEGSDWVWYDADMQRLAVLTPSDQVPESQ